MFDLHSGHHSGPGGREWQNGGPKETAAHVAAPPRQLVMVDWQVVIVTHVLHTYLRNQDLYVSTYKRQPSFGWYRSTYVARPERAPACLQKFL